MAMVHRGAQLSMMIAGGMENTVPMIVKRMQMLLPMHDGGERSSCSKQESVVGTPNEGT